MARCQFGSESLVGMMITCFRCVSAPLLRHAATLSRPPAGRLCRHEPALWRLGHAPVSEFSRLPRPQVCGSRLLGLKCAEGRTACWGEVLRLPGETALRYPGGHGRSAASFLSLLTPSGARGLCSQKVKEAAPPPGSSATADREEAGPIPGQGLFKFKELVSCKL